MNDGLQDSDTALTIGTRDELRLRVLRVLEVKPKISQRELAAELGVSLGGINYAIKALIERGFVKVNNFRKSGSKTPYLYVLTPQGVAEKASLATAFLARKLEEYEVLRREIEALKVEVGSNDSPQSERWLSRGRRINEL